MFLNNCFILSLAFLVWCGFCPSLLGLKSCLKFITRALVPFSLRWMLSFLKRSWFLLMLLWNRYRTFKFLHMALIAVLNVYFCITPSGSPNIFVSGWNHFKTVSHSTGCWRLLIAKKFCLNGKNLSECNPEIFSWHISTLCWTKFQVCPSKLYHKIVSGGKQTFFALHSQKTIINNNSSSYVLHERRWFPVTEFSWCEQLWSWSKYVASTLLWIKQG